MTAYTEEEIARVCHAAVTELQALHGDPAPSLPGDTGDAAAHAATAAGIRAVLGGATPEQLHETWCQAREARDWKQGPRKDSRLKTHPALVPYGDLPECQRVKDRVFAAVVRAMSAGEAECPREQLAVIRGRLGTLAAGLELSASASAPSKKSEIERGCAAAVREIAGTP